MILVIITCSSSMWIECETYSDDLIIKLNIKLRGNSGSNFLSFISKEGWLRKVEKKLNAIDYNGKYEVILIYLVSHK